MDRLSDWEKHRYNMSNGRQGDEPEAVGNPNLRYVSKFVEGWEPSGVPVCVIYVHVTLIFVSVRSANLTLFPMQDAIEITRCTGVDELDS